MVDVLRVYATFLPQTIGKKQYESVHTQCISKNFLN